MEVKGETKNTRYIKNILENKSAFQNQFQNQLKRSRIIGSGKDIPVKRRKKEKNFDKLTFDASFSNLYSGVIVGKHNSGKTSLVQRIVRNGLLPYLEKIIIVTPSTIQNSYKISNEKYYQGYDVVYYEADNKSELDDVLEEIEQSIQSTTNETTDDSDFNDASGEKSKKVKYLVILDDMTGKAEKSNKLAYLYTTSRKIETLVLTILHRFSAAVENLISCSDFVILFTIPGNSSYLKSFLCNEGKKVTSIKKQERNQAESWLYRLQHSDLSQTRFGHLLIMQESPLTDDSDYVGKGPFSFRTQCDNPQVQIGYFPSQALNSKVDSYDSYKLLRKNDEEGIIFEIENMTKVTKGGDSFIRPETDKTSKNVKQKEREIINDQ